MRCAKMLIVNKISSVPYKYNWFVYNKGILSSPNDIVEATIFWPKNLLNQIEEDKQFVVKEEYTTIKYYLT